MLTSLLASKLAIGVIASGIVVGGTTAAAYAGALPSGLQDLAHQRIGAQTSDTAGPDGDQEAGDDQGEGAAGEVTDEPSDRPTDTPTATPTDSPTDSPTDDPTDMPTGGPTSGPGPDATGPAAFGLCTAWTHGGLSSNSVAYASLVTAAGAADGIATYCATIPHPGGAKRPTSGDGALPAVHGHRAGHGHRSGRVGKDRNGSHGHGHAKG